jgi:hypothetical protein
MNNAQHIYTLLHEFSINEVHLGWKTFSIRLQNQVIVEGELCEGYSNFSDSVILLDSTLGNDEARSCIIHELLHCWFEMTGYDEVDDIKGCIQLTNERLVNITTNGLITIRRLNPKLMELLFS